MQDRDLCVDPDKSESLEGLTNLDSRNPRVLRFVGGAGGVERLGMLLVTSVVTRVPSRKKVKSSNLV